MRLPTPSSFDHDRSRAPRRFLRRCPVMPAIDGIRSHCSRGDTNCTPSRRRSGHADGADGTTPGGANGSRRGTSRIRLHADVGFGRDGHTVLAEGHSRRPVRPRIDRRAHMGVTVSAVDWLLESDEPGIVAQAKRDLLDEQAPAEAARVIEGPKVYAARRPAGGRRLRHPSTRNGAAPTGGSSRSSSSASRPASRAVSRLRRPSLPGSPARAIATAFKSSTG